MPVRPEILIYAPQGHLAAAIDTYALPGRDAEWGALFRRNLVEHGGYPKVEFYLFVTPDRMWLWKDVPPKPEFVLPTLDLSASEALAPYFTRFRTPPDQAMRHTMFAVVDLWLTELTWGQARPPENLRPLVETGFFEAIRDGNLILPDAA
ncbi:MAG TPA: hypothetical protein VHG91_04100 [Longimicrobium sp.]|nr:hypothetical protein [Longimicrobium sp.]